MKESDIKIGKELLIFDSHDGKWYHSRITKLGEKNFIAKDIDKHSALKNCIWVFKNKDIGDKTKFKELED